MSRLAVRARSIRPRASDSGTVTAELAVAVTALVPLIVAVISLVALLLAQLSVTSAASTGARLLARGEDRPAVEWAVLHAAGPRARMQTRPDGALTHVLVTRTVPVLGRDVVVTGSAVAPTESGLAAPARSP